MGDVVEMRGVSTSKHLAAWSKIEEPMSSMDMSHRLTKIHVESVLTTDQQADSALLASLLSSGHVGHLVSDRLMAHFGSFASVISTSAAELYRFGGLTKAEVLTIKAVHAAAIRLVRSELDDRCVISDRKSLVDYVFASYSRDDTEVFHVLFLNSCNRLLSDEVLAYGTINHVTPSPREILKRAIELNATALILVHNHPSGDQNPSRQDIEATSFIVDMVSNLDIKVHDHIVISRNGISSFRDLGLLPGSP